MTLVAWLRTTALDDEKVIWCENRENEHVQLNLQYWPILILKNVNNRQTWQLGW